MFEQTTAIPSPSSLSLGLSLSFPSYRTARIVSRRGYMYRLLFVLTRYLHIRFFDFRCDFCPREVVILLGVRLGILRLVSVILSYPNL